MADPVGDIFWMCSRDSVVAASAADEDDRVTTQKRSHLGKAGHHAVMAEFLLRGWNVAIPEVDVGEDIFVVDDNADRVTRVQVKTTEQVARTGGATRAKYGGIAKSQFWSSSEMPFYYVFVLREGRAWDFVVLKRKELQPLRAETEAAAAVENAPEGRRPGPKPRPTKPAGDASGTTTLVLTFTATDVTTWGRSLQNVPQQLERVPGGQRRARGHCQSTRSLPGSLISIPPSRSRSARARPVSRGAAWSNTSPCIRSTASWASKAIVMREGSFVLGWASCNRRSLRGWSA